MNIEAKNIPWWLPIVVGAFASGIIGIILQHNYYEWRDRRDKERMA